FKLQAQHGGSAARPCLGFMSSIPSVYIPHLRRSEHRCANTTCLTSIDTPTSVAPSSLVASVRLVLERETESYQCSGDRHTLFRFACVVLSVGADDRPILCQRRCTGSSLTAGSESLLPMLKVMASMVNVDNKYCYFFPRPGRASYVICSRLQCW
ncbi:hypothetical protein BDN67DRAFT_962317, partial [Paxillus ammoniavirescens]